MESKDEVDREFQSNEKAKVSYAIKISYTHLIFQDFN